jgi:hypothetical protein
VRDSERSRWAVQQFERPYQGLHLVGSNGMHEWSDGAVRHGSRVLGDDVPQPPLRGRPLRHHVDLCVRHVYPGQLREPRQRGRRMHEQLRLHDERVHRRQVRGHERVLERQLVKMPRRHTSWGVGNQPNLLASWCLGGFFSLVAQVNLVLARRADRCPERGVAFE